MGCPHSSASLPFNSQPRRGILSCYSAYRTLAARGSSPQGLTAEEHARAEGYVALALMLQQSLLGISGADVGGQARPVLALVVEKADAAMAALLAEESWANKD